MYNAKGQRTKKNSIEYYYDSQGRLIKQSNGLEFYYDITGLIGFKYIDSYFTYRKDAQGNIIAIVDKDGKVRANYDYDAWGNHTVTGAQRMLGEMNPFRYRGYYYDTETKLYYLQTRYYDPETGRFLNMDSIDYADPRVLNGLNLYAYCNNNPIGLKSQNGVSLSVSPAFDFVMVDAVTRKPTQFGNSSNESGGNGGSGWDFIKSNHVLMENQTFSLFNNPILKAVLGNVSYIRTRQLNEPEIFYSFTNVGTGGMSEGVGINLLGVLGGNIYHSDMGIGASLQLGPLFTFGIGISLTEGISLSGGIIKGDVTHEIAINAGWGTIAGIFLGALGAPAAVAGAVYKILKILSFLFP